MNHLVKLDTLAERLRLKPITIRRMIPVDNSEVQAHLVIHRLNSARRGTQPLVDGIPSDLMTPAEAAELVYPLEQDRNSLLINRLSAKRGVAIPHFYLSKHAIRFSRAALEIWMASAGDSTRRLA